MSFSRETTLSDMHLGKMGKKKLHLCREDEGKGKIVGMLQGVDNSDGEESQGPKL